jgi:ADP-heptose:LPS heptosyltransferase
MTAIAQPRKIAVLRANALGDYIFVLPALRALKETFPEAEIVYLGRQWHKEYLTGRPGPVDRVVVVPPYPGISEAEGFMPDHQELQDFFRQMQDEKFDLAFQLHGGGRNSNPFVNRLGAALTLGLQTPDAEPLDVNLPYVYYFSEILRYLEVVALAGARTASIDPVAAVTDADLEEMRRVTGAVTQLAVVHPGASDLRRRWPPEKFAAVIRHLYRIGFRVCITGAPFEREVIDAIMARLEPGEAENLCGQLTLGGMTGLLASAEVVISNDTGPLHLARALGRPTIGIYWCGNAITGLPMATRHNRPLISFKTECPLCGLPANKFGQHDSGTCDHATSFVGDVSVEDACEAIDELLLQIQAAPPGPGVAAA